MRLRRRQTDRKPRRAADFAASAGAGQGARDGPSDGDPFEGAVLKIGLSWPSLSKALGRPVDDPSRWAVLYLGSVKAIDLESTDEVVALNRKGELDESQRAILRGIEGVVLLDGTWSQAKALWWRNAWMLKCQRVILGPSHPSRYGKLRREPRGDGLSTIEAAGLVLSRLEGRPDIAETLNASFTQMLNRYRGAVEEQPSLAPKPRPRRDFRRRRRAERDFGGRPSFVRTQCSHRLPVCVWQAARHLFMAERSAPSLRRPNPFPWLRPERARLRLREFGAFEILQGPMLKIQQGPC